MHLHYVWIILLALCVAVSSQDFSIPSGWLKTTTNRTREERIDIAQKAIEQVTNFYNSTTGEFNSLLWAQSANMMCAIAHKDYVAGTTDNQELVSQSLSTIASLANQPAPYVGTSPWWSLASIYAYKAYKDPVFLWRAQETWDLAYTYLVTPENAAQGTHPKKTVSIVNNCNGSTTAGGVFYDTDPTDAGAFTVSTSEFTAVAGYLAEITGASNYSDAALLTANFTNNHLISNYLPQDTFRIDLGGIDTCRIQFNWTYNTGLVLESFALLYNTTNTQDYLQNTLLNVIVTTSKEQDWQGSDGIIDASNELVPGNIRQSYKAFMIRGFYVARERLLPVHQDAANLMEAYINVQYNSLLDSATANGSNIYSANWRGPPINSATASDQLSALDVLAAAIGPSASASSSSILTSTATGSSSSGTASTETSTNSSGSSGSPNVQTHHNRIPEYVGIAAGVIIILILLGAFITWRRRIRRKRQFNVLPQSSSETFFMDPISEDTDTKYLSDFRSTISSTPPELSNNESSSEPPRSRTQSMASTVPTSSYSDSTDLPSYVSGTNPPSYPSSAIRSSDPPMYAV